MAFGDVVQSNSGTSTLATTSPTLPGSVTAGNLILLLEAADDYPSGANTGWTKSTGLSQAGGLFHGSNLWWFIASSNGQAIPSITIGSAVRSNWHLAEIQGPFDVSPYDTSNGQSANTGGSSYTTPAITPSTGSRFLVAANTFQNSSSDLGAPGTWLNSFTQITSTVFNGANPRLSIGMARRIVTGDGVTTFSSGSTMASGSALSRAGLIASFKAGSSTPVLVGADSFVVVTCDTGALTQHHVLVAADSAVAVTCDSGALVQHHVLSADDSTVAVTCDTATLAASVPIAAADCTVTSSCDTADLTQHQILTAADSTVTTTCTTGALVQHQVLVAADSVVGSTSTTADLVQHHVMVGDDSAVTVTCDSATLTVAGQLAADDCLVLVACTTATLAQHQQLTAADSAVAVTCTTATLSASVALVAADCTVAVTSTAATLTQHHVLVAQDSLVTVTCDTATLRGPAVVVLAFGPATLTAAALLGRPTVTLSADLGQVEVVPA